MKKFQRSTGSANGPASCDSDREGGAAERVPNVKDSTSKKPASDAKTLWVKTFRCFECGKSSHKMPKCRQCFCCGRAREAVDPNNDADWGSISLSLAQHRRTVTCYLPRSDPLD